MTLTKEWLLKTIAGLEEERDATPGAVNEDAAMALAAMKLALASLEAEAVAWRYRFVHTPKSEEHGSPFTTDWVLAHSEEECNPSDCFERQPLYIAPPAPVAMKDHQIRALVNELRDIAVEYYGTQQLRERIAKTVRAAMLQGAEPVQGWIPCSERMPDEYDYDIWIYSPGKGVYHGVAYAGGGEFMDDECQFKIDDATHWMPMIMPAAPRQEDK